MKKCWGIGGICPCILNLGTRWRCQLHAPASLPWGKTPRYPLDRRLGGSESRSGCCGRELKRKLPMRPFFVRVFRWN